MQRPGLKHVAAMSLTVAAVAAVALVLVRESSLAGKAQQVASDRQPRQTAVEPPTPAFGNRQPAENPAALNLVVDDRKVLGWISGTEDHAGRTVTVVTGERQELVTIGRGNTFTWHYEVLEPTDVSFRYGDFRRTARLRPIRQADPTVFFVVDRTVYRPNQTLHFAGFLRRPDRQGEFVPIAEEEVEVRLTSRQKSTVAARLKLTADEFGRITGQYTFSEADALDTYDLSIDGYKGSAELKLAEFRKAKVKLEIDGERDGTDLKLTFRALDFLDKPVPGSSLHYKAQVIKNAGSRKEHPLDAQEFVYAGVIPPGAAGGLWGGLWGEEQLSEDERLLRDAGVPVMPSGGQGSSMFVAQREGDLVMGKQGRVEHTLALESEWTKGSYSVVVQGVLVDYNGREQRANKVISLAEETQASTPAALRSRGAETDVDLSSPALSNSRAAAAAVKLGLPNRYVAAGERFSVRVEVAGPGGEPIESDTTVVASRLVPTTTNRSPHYGYGYYSPYLYSNSFGYWNRGWNYGRLNRLLYSNGVRAYWQRAAGLDQKPIRRDMVTAVVVKDGRATLKLDEPGAYKLLCVAKLPDGRELQDEVGCVVRRKKELPGLLLKLDRDTLQTGDVLRGEIHSRFDGAEVLLTIRDSSGIRWWRTYNVDDGAVRFAEPLPQGLRYGCHADVQYRDGEGRMHVDGKFLRVEPVERMVSIDVKTEESYRPGEEVTLDLQVQDESAGSGTALSSPALSNSRAAASPVNRKRPVDLVVSVYDQSLLGIAADNSVDIRNFYLADERVRHSVAQETLRRMIGDVTVRELAEKGKSLLENEPDLKQTPEGQMLDRAVRYYHNNRYVDMRALPALLAMAGVDAQFDPLWTSRYGYGWNINLNAEREKTNPVRLLDLFGHAKNGWHLGYDLRGDTLSLLSYHDNHVNRWNRYGNGILGGGIYGPMMARGDARFSLSANGFYSYVPGGNSALSAQAFISHVPAGQPVNLIDADDPGVAVRRDFSDSAFWNARVRTDANGRAQVTFTLPDSLTNWRVVVTAISPDMHVGQVSESFRTYKPVMVWPMLPRTFTEGDLVDVFAAVHNRTDEPQEMDVSLKVENGTVHGPKAVRVRVPAGQQVPVYWTFEAGKAGYTQLLMTARCQAGSDASLKRLPVSRMAAEEVVTASGLCRDTARLVIPSDVNLENSEFELMLVPSLADDMVQSLDYLVQYPYGCVEQTMSRFLPSIRVAQTLKRAGIEKPELEKKLPEVVEAGIKRLLQLQRPGGGWGWHGGTRTHEMMTPYALYGLLQAEKAGYEIPNAGAVDRGLSRLQSFISAMGEQQAADRIYCMYVYSHRNKIPAEWWTFIKEQMQHENLSDYALALSLEMMMEQKGRTATANQLARALEKRATHADGAAYWTTANFSRWGDDRFEITAAVMKALVAYDSDHELIPEILSFFNRTKRGNRWNSTKDTATIIYALCDYLATQDFRPDARYTLGLRINGGERLQATLETGQVSRITLAGTELKHGPNRIRFEGHAPGGLYRAVFRHWVESRDIPPMESGMKVTRRFYLMDSQGNQQRELKAGDSVPRGSYIKSVVRVEHKLGTGMQYVLVENPKPSCCEILPADDSRFQQSSANYALREERTRGVVFHHEQTGATIQDVCILHAELAGQYLVPPARAEMMYQTETRGHSGGFYFKVEGEPAVASRK